jgi:NADH-quinone oxidoreductase subunit K
MIRETLFLSIILFGIGATGFVVRRNAIVVLMSLELMLNAVNLAFIAFARQHIDVTGQIYVFIIMTVAAAEAAVGLAIVVLIFRTRRAVNLDEINLMKG